MREKGLIAKINSCYNNSKIKPFIHLKNIVPEATALVTTNIGLYYGIQLSEHLNLNDEMTVITSTGIRLSSFLLGKSAGFYIMHKDEFKNSLKENTQKLKDLVKVGVKVQIPNYSLAAATHYLFEKVSTQDEKLVLLPMITSANIAIGAYILRSRLESQKGILQKYE